MRRPILRCLLAEAIGTFALVFAGCGAIMVDSKTSALGHVGVAISFGLVIMVMIYAVGHISGAHFNSAVTLAFALSRHFPRPRVVGYWTAQLGGATATALVLRASLGDVAHIGRRFPPARTAGLPVGGGAHLPAHVRDHGGGHGHPCCRRGRRRRDRGNGRPRRHVRRPCHRGVDEPARSLGPAIAAADYASVWLYVAAPFAGAAIAALTYQFLRAEPTTTLKAFAAPEAAETPHPSARSEVST